MIVIQDVMLTLFLPVFFASQLICPTGAFPLPLEEPSLINASNEADEGNAIMTAGSGQVVESGSGREENVITIGEGSGAAETGSGGMSGLSSGQGSGAEQETIDRGGEANRIETGSGSGQKSGSGEKSTNQEGTASGNSLEGQPGEEPTLGIISSEESGDLVGKGQENGTEGPSGEGGNGVSGESGNIESGSGVIDIGNGVWLGGGVSRIATSTTEKPTDEGELATRNIFQLLQALREAYPYKTNK